VTQEHKVGPGPRIHKEHHRLGIFHFFGAALGHFHLGFLVLLAFKCRSIYAEGTFLACLPRKRVDPLTEGVMGEGPFLLACFLVVIGCFSVEPLRLVLQKITLRGIMCVVAPAVLAIKRTVIVERKRCQNQ
jgi:hypothetical protein